MPSYCLPLLVLLLMCGVWLGVEAAISEDAVLLTLSGDLEMTASWTDSPRSGSTYNVYILTNFRDPPSSAVHVKNGLTFDAGLTQMSYAITAANFNEFTPIGATVGNFPGFEHGELYRLYIEYYDASGAQLNTGVELSEFATPMIKAAAPRNLTDCGLFGTHMNLAIQFHTPLELFIHFACIGSPHFHVAMVLMFPRILTRLNTTNSKFQIPFLLNKYAQKRDAIGVLLGMIFSREWTLKILRHLLFTTFLALNSITSVYLMQKLLLFKT